MPDSTMPAGRLRHRFGPSSPADLSPLMLGVRGSWVMTLNRDGGPPSEEGVQTAWYLHLKAKIIEKIGCGGGAARTRQRRLRHEERQAVGEATLLLRPARDPWEPEGGWEHGWADSLPWYRPDDGDQGMPVGGPARLPDFTRPCPTCPAPAAGCTSCPWPSPAGPATLAAWPPPPPAPPPPPETAAAPRRRPRRAGGKAGSG